MELFRCPDCGHTQSEGGECGKCGCTDMIRGRACLRCGDFDHDFDLCEKCVDELDRSAMLLLESCATKAEIKEWATIHRMEEQEWKK